MLDRRGAFLSTELACCHQLKETIGFEIVMAEPNFRDHRIYIVHLFRVLHKHGPSVPADIYDEVVTKTLMRTDNPRQHL